MVGKEKSVLGKIWYFIWEDNSVWSWIVNIVLAFVLIKFLVYPGLGFALQTTHPVVAVVSSSMEHDARFDTWWEENGDWYTAHGINKNSFEEFQLKNGFNKGDIMILRGGDPEEFFVGDVIVFISHRESPRADPIIHRVVEKQQLIELQFKTKGDNNQFQIDSCDGLGCLDETDIQESQIIGKAVIRIPFLGFIKIWFVNLLSLVGG